MEEKVEWIIEGIIIYLLLLALTSVVRALKKITSYIFTIFTDTLVDT